MSARVLVFSTALLSGAATLGAQTAERMFFRPSTRPFSLEVETGSVFDTNLDRDGESVHSQGFITRLIFEAKKPAGNRVLLFRYIGDLQSYTGSDRFDRGTSNLTGVYYHGLTPKLSLTAVGGFSQRGPEGERLPADQYSGWSQLRYRASPAAEIGVFGSYRWARPDDESWNENVLVAGIDFGGEVGGRSVWEVGYQREQSDSPTPGRDYRVDKFRAEYAWRLGLRTSLGVRLDREKWLYPEWSFLDGDLATFSQEWEWFPSAFLLHRFDSGRLLTLRWELQERTTNYGYGAWKGQRLHATFRVPIVGGRPAMRRPGDGIPLPKLPDDVPTPDPPILQQLAYLARTAEFSDDPAGPTGDGSSFTRGSHWKEVLAAQGVPTGATEKPHFFEQVWQYGPSWVTFHEGHVVSWHDAGNLKVDPEGMNHTPPPPAPRLIEPPAKSKAPPFHSTRTEKNDETISSAFLRVANPEIVLADGTHVKGVLIKYENGLAHVLLFLENDRTLLATMPEHLIDKQATTPVPGQASDGGDH